jgi:hypothetical protein
MSSIILGSEQALDLEPPTNMGIQSIYFLWQKYFKGCMHYTTGSFTLTNSASTVNVSKITPGQRKGKQV